MLAPDTRSLLIDQLVPPPGLRFDAAVATTFTLDLTATLLPALAFTGFGLGGSTSDPIATLEAIRSTAESIDVFCQAGAIGVPGQSPDLLAFIEPIVHPVAAPSGGLFHPKTWFIRYVDEAGRASYRLLVLTRNLTMDSSWDLAVRLDSERVEDGERAESAALGDFISTLTDRAVRAIPPERRKRIEGLADEARRIEWELPEHAQSVLLHYLDAGRESSMDLSGSRHLVVSPFVDSGGLRAVRPKGRIEILSRAEELDRLDSATIGRLKARVLDELAVVQGVEGSRLGGQLHAKMYVVDQSSNWSKSHVFIGSANATGAAFTSNTEFMVEIRGHRKHFGVDRFLGDDGTFVAMTEAYRPTTMSDPDTDELMQRELDNALRRLGGLEYVVDVVASERAGAQHQVQIRSNRSLPVESGWHLTVELLTLGDRPITAVGGSILDVHLLDVGTADITPFLALRVESPTGLRSSTVVVADLRNAPPDRLDVVLARQIDTPDKFLRFVFFLLSLANPAALAALSTGGTNDGATTQSPFGAGASGVLEMVLAALATSPSALAELDTLVRRLESTEDGRRSLPDGFAAFWVVVREALEGLIEVQG